MRTETASFPIAEFKATEGTEHRGLFAARISAFGNKDLNGERVMAGAFDRTIEDKRSRNQSIPVVWSHGHEDPEAFIGEASPSDVKITEKGVVVAGRMFVDEYPRAAKVFDLMKKGLITSWSFAFTPTKERVAKDGVREILDLDLFEVGPTLVGANPEAQTIALKALGIDEKAIENKRGARISAATAATLRDFQERLAALQTDLVTLLGVEDAVEEDSAPITEAEKLRLSLAEIDAFLAERNVA